MVTGVQHSAIAAPMVPNEFQLMQDREREVMVLLGASCPERIVHDLRNVLNEVQLLRALAEQM